MDRADGPGELPAEMRSSRTRDRRAAIIRLGALTPEQSAELQSLRDTEPDAWVRRGLDRHLDSGDRPELAVETTETLVDPETAREIREDARVEIAELIVHELRHSLLHIELAAEREVPDFGTSDTLRALDNFRTVADTLSQFADASRAANLVEVTLGDVVAEFTVDLRQSLFPPDLVGPPDTVAHVDPGLLRLAVANCVRNAVEASSTADRPARPVVLTWGKTDRDAWIAIHDDGCGLAGVDLERVFEPHQTTKGGSGHAGLGLAIARRALQAMDGDVVLVPRSPRGATCELRWPQSGRR